MIHKITAITLLLFAIIQADTLTLRAGLNGFGGLIDASIHNPHGGAKLGGVWPQAGSSWC